MSDFPKSNPNNCPFRSFIPKQTPKERSEPETQIDCVSCKVQTWNSESGLCKMCSYYHSLHKHNIEHSRFKSCTMCSFVSSHPEEVTVTEVSPKKGWFSWW